MNKTFLNLQVCLKGLLACMLTKLQKPYTYTDWQEWQTFSINDVTICLLKAMSKAFKRGFDTQQFQGMILGLWKEWQG